MITCPPPREACSRVCKFDASAGSGVPQRWRKRSQSPEVDKPSVHTCSRLAAGTGGGRRDLCTPRPARPKRAHCAAGWPAMPANGGASSRGSSLALPFFGKIPRLCSFSSIPSLSAEGTSRTRRRRSEAVGSGGRGSSAGSASAGAPSSGTVMGAEGCCNRSGVSKGPVFAAKEGGWLGPPQWGGGCAPPPETLPPQWFGGAVGGVQVPGAGVPAGPPRQSMCGSGRGGGTCQAP
mmetsp:Transcript_56224/g.131778  ORF Transcript_56224/g.131778 Transcript_56224/m.131778 type:complete len:235 (+) Transcript_56224:128-832(+)